MTTAELSTRPPPAPQTPSSSSSSCHDCILPFFVQLHTSHTSLRILFECFSLRRDWLIAATRRSRSSSARPPRVSLSKQTQAVAPDNFSTLRCQDVHYKKKKKKEKNWPSCYQVSAVTSTDFDYKNCRPVRNQGLPLQGHFPQQTSVSPPLLLPPDSPHRMNCSCRLLYLQVFDATAHSRVYILRVATFYLIHPYPSLLEMYLFVSF